MTSRTIELIVSPQGETRLETKGFAGTSCQTASRFLEQALGTKSAEQLTAEFYQPAVQSQPLQQQGGRT
jgi:hypothetical protein